MNLGPYAIKMPPEDNVMKKMPKLITHSTKKKKETWAINVPCKV